MIGRRRIAPRGIAGFLACVIASLLTNGCGPRATRILDRPQLTGPAAANDRNAPPLLLEEHPGPPADGHYFAAAAGDVNGDGLADLAAGSFEPGGISVWVAREDPAWQHSFVPFPSSEVRDVLIADLDNDGRDEIVVVSRGGIEGLLVLRAPREGAWQGPVHISSGSDYESVAAGDLNNDGRLDLVVARGGDVEDGGIEVWLADANGTFRGGNAPLSGSAFRDVVLDDLDGDGRLDLLAAGWGLTEGIRVLLGDGRGGFSSGPVLGAPGRYRGLALGDVTGDGNTDLVATTYRSGVVVFPRVDPDAPRCTIIEDGSFWSVLLADSDRNGRPEIYASSSNGLGILAWKHERGCEFRYLDSGLPDRDVWYGLSLDRIRPSGPDEIIAAGLSGLRFFAPAGSAMPSVSSDPLPGRGPEVAEEAFAHGNDAFTTALGYDEYRLGVGDHIQIRVFNGSEVQETEAIVQSDGEIFVPVRGVGSVKAADHSPSQLKRTLFERVSQIWKEPDVEVVVIRYEAHKVSLLGEVRTMARSNSGPGQYALKGKTRVVDFLSEHGGPTDRADLNRVQLIRPTGRSSYLNLYQAIFASDRNENPIVNDGDTLFVPSVTLSNRRVFMLGQVVRPGLLELRENISLLEAVARVGGFTEKAVLSKVLVVRGGLEAPELIAVNFKDLLERGDLSSDVVLRNGDVVYVPRRKIVKVKELFAAIQPALSLIEDLFIIDELANSD